MDNTGNFQMHVTVGLLFLVMGIGVLFLHYRSSADDERARKRGMRIGSFGIGLGLLILIVAWALRLFVHGL